MHDLRGVGGRDAAARLHDDVRGARDRQASLAGEQRGQALAHQVLHDDVRRPVFGDPEVDGRGHVLVLERAGRLGLALKAREDVAALGEIAAQELDREAAPQDRVLRLVDDAHAALREQADDAVLAAGELADPIRLRRRLHRTFSPSLRMVSRSTPWPSISRYARWRLMPSTAAARATFPPAARSAAISAGS